MAPAASRKHVGPQVLNRLHPLATVSALSAVFAVLLPFVTLGVPLSASSLAAIGLLASPFLVLLFGHLRASRSVRKNMVLAIANVPLWCAWLLVAFLMWYSQAGWYGVAVFAPLLAALAGICIFLSHLVREPHNHGT